MASFIQSPTEIAAAGTKPKIIEEFFGRVNSNTESVSIARMKSPCGWEEPAQTPEFDEYTVVLKGMLRITHENTRQHGLPIFMEATVVLIRGWSVINSSTHRYKWTWERDTEAFLVCRFSFCEHIYRVAEEAVAGHGFRPPNLIQA